MGQGLELTGLAGTLALAVPLVLLFLIVIRGTRSKSRRRPATTQAPIDANAEVDLPPTVAVAGEAAPEARSTSVEYGRGGGPVPPQPDTSFGAPVAAGDGGTRLAPVPAPFPAAGLPPVAEAMPAGPASQEEPLQEPSPPDPVEVARERAVLLAREVARAEAEGREPDLPGLCIEEAKALSATGDVAAAADRLRKSLRVSAKLGLKLEHAMGRIELGDLAAQHGDLTTACEHWSIARSLVHELKRPDEIKGVEARMRNNGCPTDWVLNDF